VFDDADSPASHALLSAALSGLLCVALPACTTNRDSADSNSVSSTFECDGGVAADAGITSSMMVANMTMSDFSSQCAMRNGIMETIAECRGANTCRGMSYDTETQTLTQHTCRATNTCGGYSCVICD